MSLTSNDLRRHGSLADARRLEIAGALAYGSRGRAASRGIFPAVMGGRMRKVLLAVLLQVAIGSPVIACTGQKGAVIFEDAFEDDTGGWQSLPASVVKPPHMQITLGSKLQTLSIQNLTFNAIDADYCMTFALPASAKPDNSATMGILFLGTDVNNTFALLVSSQAKISMHRKQDNAWTPLYAEDAPLKSEPDALNELRVIVKAGRITSMLNGKEIKVIRALIPQGRLKFGVYAQADKELSEDMLFNVKQYKVTTGN